MRRSWFLIYTTVFLIVFLPWQVLAASTVTISPSADSAFVIRGIGVDGAAAIDITITYDTAVLSNPRVTAGPMIAGAMTAVNVNQPGTLRMAIIRTSPIKGDGVIASLAFDRKENVVAKINSLNVRLVNINGGTIPSQAQVVNPTETAAVASTSLTKEAMPSTKSAGSTEADSGVPSTQQFFPFAVTTIEQPKADGNSVTPAATSNEDSVQPSRPSSAGEAVMASVPPSNRTDSPAARDQTVSSKAPASRIFTQQSVLERFKVFKGELTVANLIRLFENDSLVGFHQDPPIVLSDGKRVVKASFLSTPGNRTAADVAVIGARFISLKRDPDNTNTWVVDLVPEKDTCQASIAVSHGEMKMVYPLTVARKVRIPSAASGTPTQADFDRFLKQRRTAVFDLNRDGKRDYIDEYIFTANYLASKKK